MPRQDVMDLFRPFSKEVLIRFILRRSISWMARKDEVLRDLRYIEWDLLSGKSLALLDESIEMQKGEKVFSPRWNKAQELYRQADKFGKKAERLYARIEAQREKP